MVECELGRERVFALAKSRKNTLRIGIKDLINVSVASYQRP